MDLGMLRRSSTNMSMCVTWNRITVCSGGLSTLSKEKSTMAHLQSRAPCRYGFNEQSSYQALKGGHGRKDYQRMCDLSLVLICIVV